MTRLLEILYNEGSDTIVLGDTETGDDIAEVFHNERHTVNQTVKQALETARLFAAAHDMLSAASRLMTVFDQQKMTQAERIIVGVSDAGLRTEGNAAIEALRAAIAKAPSL